MKGFINTAIIVLALSVCTYSLNNRLRNDTVERRVGNDELRLIGKSIERSVDQQATIQMQLVDIEQQHMQLEKAEIANRDEIAHLAKLLTSRR